MAYDEGTLMTILGEALHERSLQEELVDALTFTPQEVLVNGYFDDISDLVNVVESRSPDEAVVMVNMLHEIAKLFVAGQLPTPTLYYSPRNSAQGYLYSGDEIRKNHILHNHLSPTIPAMELDDDGIPMGLRSVPQQD